MPWWSVSLGVAKKSHTGQRSMRNIVRDSDDVTPKTPELIKHRRRGERERRRKKTSQAFSVSQMSCLLPWKATSKQAMDADWDKIAARRAQALRYAIYGTAFMLDVPVRSADTFPFGKEASGRFSKLDSECVRNTPPEYAMWFTARKTRGIRRRRDRSPRSNRYLPASVRSSETETRLVTFPKTSAGINRNISTVDAMELDMSIIVQLRPVTRVLPGKAT